MVLGKKEFVSILLGTSTMKISDVDSKIWTFNRSKSYKKAKGPVHECSTLIAIGSGNSFVPTIVEVG